MPGPAGATAGDASGPLRQAPGFGLPLIGPLIISPARAFRDLADRPKEAWIGPLVVCALLGTLAAWVMLPEILDVSYNSAVAMMDKMGVPQADREQALASIPSEPNTRVVLTQVLPNLVIVPVFLLIGAAFVHFVSRLLGSQSGFGPTLGMFSLAYVIWAVGGMVRAALAAVADTVDVTLGPGALLPGVPVLSGWGIFLDLFDIFSLWHLYVLAVGIAVVTRASRGTAWGVALSYWVIRSLLLAGGKVFMLWTQGG